MNAVDIVHLNNGLESIIYNPGVGTAACEGETARRSECKRHAGVGAVVLVRT